MDARDLIAGWPTLADADAKTLLASPAWCMSVDFNGGDGRLTRSSAVDGELFLEVSLDDSPVLLGIADSEGYPDLHRLWPRLADLPNVMTVALVEREVGPLLQVVENLVRKELRLVGVAAEAPGAEGQSRTAFRLEAGETSYGFSLVLSAETERALGVLDNLDVEHESIRSLTRTVRVEYAAVDLTDQEVAAIVPGDSLLADLGAASWRTELSDGNGLFVCSSDESTVSFAQLADGTLPSIPPPQALTVFFHGKPFASAVVASVGSAPAVKVTALL